MAMRLVERQAAEAVGQRPGSRGHTVVDLGLVQITDVDGDAGAPGRRVTLRLRGTVTSGCCGSAEELPPPQLGG